MPENSDRERLARLEAELSAFHKLVDTKFSERDKAVMAELRERDKALSLHERELGSHLERLNHAHSDAVAKESSFVSMAEYSRDRERWAEWRQDMSEFKSRVIGIAIGCALGGGLVTGLILQLIKKA
jgi:hypothetical protein